METDAEWKAFDAIAAEARRSPVRVERLAYRAPGTMSVAAQPGDDAAPETGAAETGTGGKEYAEPGIVEGLEARLIAAEAARSKENEELRREGRAAVEAARREAGIEAERRAQAEIDRAARQIGAALESFRREREEYFARVEREVVELALAIAARILHREALLDPMLLAGAVRVALGQLGETTGVRLRCPAGEVEGWRKLLGELPLPAGTVPEIVADPALEAGDCVLEARVGTVNLGVKAQLAEIERGFFDLLERRPGLGTRDIGT